MKKIYALSLMLIIIFAAALSAHAEDLAFTTGQTLPKGQVNVPYSATIAATGGTDPYSFTLAETGSLPPGLTLDENGTISGTPTYGGLIFGNVDVVVTDKDLNTAEQTFRISIAAQRVTFRIGENNFSFDGSRHTVTAAAYYNGSPVDIDYTITVGGQANQTDVGSYPISITVKSPGYMFRSMDKTHLYINKNSNVELTFSGNTRFPYDSDTHTPSVSVTGKLTESSEPVNLDYTVNDEGLDVDYSSDSAPSMPGNYLMTVTVDSANYATPSNNYIEFEILHNTVNFTLNDTSAFYQGDTWDRYYSPDQTLSKPFTVKYVKNGTEYDAPSSGSYTVKITLDDDDSALYSVGAVTPAVINVAQLGAAVSVTNASKQFTNTGLLPDMEANLGMTLGTDYHITLSNTDTSDTAEYTETNMPVDSGSYSYTISLDPSSPYSMTPVTGTFTITPVTVKITLSPSSFKFDNTEHTPAVDTEPADLDTDLYSVKYSLDGSEAPVKAVGEYDAVITLSDTKNYTLSEDSTKKVTVSENPVDFTVSASAFTYGDGLTHTASVTALDSDGNDFTGFSVSYSNQDASDTTVYSDTNPPQNAGTYDIKITVTSDGYSKGTVTGDSSFTIAKKSIAFSSSKTEFEYTGSDIDPLPYISADPSDTGAAYTIVYHKSPSTDDLSSLSGVGTYTAEIRFSGTDANNYEASSSIGTLSVVEKKINITVENTSYNFDTDPHTATVTAEDEGGTAFTAFTVTYTNTDTSDTKTYTQSDPPVHAGTYTINISLPEGYKQGTVTGTASLVISPKELTFALTENTNVYTYDGNTHTAEITASPAVPDRTFSVAYKKQGTETSALNATDYGVYDIVISVDNHDYKRADSDTAAYTLTINQREISFTVTGSPVSYSGAGQNAAVALNDLPQDVAVPSFTYTYKNQDAEDTKEYTTTDSPVNPGTYDIIISVSDNYLVTGTYTFVIEDSVVMNIGNSPAAMIYLDTDHADNPAWQASALAYLKEHRQFSSEYLPQNCDADVKYPIMGSDETWDFDTDPNTVLVPYSIDNFKDPGIMLNGTKLTGTVSDKLIPNTELKIDGLYIVRYTDSDNNELGSRLVLVVFPLGDANSDGVVNAIDANAMKQYHTDSIIVQNALHARSWDIDKDGQLSSADRTAILNRFKTKIKPYYPWLDI